MDELLAYLKARDSEQDRQKWLDQRGYADPRHPAFLLNARTRRLFPKNDDDADLAGRTPLAVFVALPEPPLTEVIDTSQEAVWEWMNDPRRCYEPTHGGFLRGTPRIAFDGIVWDKDRSGIRSYLAVERSGVVEMALGTRIYKAWKQRIFIRFTPLIGYLWQFLGFAGDYYKTFGQTKPFTLFVGMRETDGAFLAGLAKGWKDPTSQECGWEAFPQCQEPGILVRKDKLGPAIAPELARDVVREVATKIDNAWGERIPRCYIKATHDPSQPFDIDTFHQLSSI